MSDKHTFMQAHFCEGVGLTGQRESRACSEQGHVLFTFPNSCLGLRLDFCRATFQTRKLSLTTRKQILLRQSRKACLQSHFFVCHARRNSAEYIYTLDSLAFSSLILHHTPSFLFRGTSNCLLPF